MSTALYTDVGKVVQALAFQSPETLQTAVSAGATSITLSQTPPPDWVVGATLVLDAANSSVRESVTITAPPSGTTVPISATVNAHAAGAPVVNATIAATYVAPASRWFDSLTFAPSGFAYETVTDVKEAYITKDGLMVVPLTKPKVAIANVTSFTFQPSVLDPPVTVDLTKAWIRDDCFLEAAAPNNYGQGSGIATVTYSGGYNPLPDDLVSAVTILAARLYKIRDSGYSDAVGNPDLGILTYKKPIPADVATIVQKYRRWTE